MVVIENILSANLLFWLGLGIAGVTLLHALGVLISSVKRRRLSHIAQQLQVDLLKERVSEKQAARIVQSNRMENIWSGFRKFRINKKQEEGGGVCSFYLVPHDGKPLPDFNPGQYLTFRLKPNVDGKPIIRCYSLSDSPEKSDQYYRVSIKKIPPPRDQPELPSGVSSSFFHDHLQAGDIIDTRAPSGNFFLDTSVNTPIVLIGGGIGITPVLSMLNSICDRHSRREVWFFYGVRNQSDHIMVAHLKKIESEYDNVHLRVCYSQPDESVDVLGENYHHGEMVSVDLFKRCLPSNNFDFYICGPPPMMNALVADLKDWGVPQDRVHFEAFGPASVKNASPKTDASDQQAAGHKISFSKSGKQCDWTADQGTLLELAEQQGVNIDSGCRAGSCGTCMTAIKEGEVGYLDEPSASLESGSCLPCIAIPKTAVTIDA